MCINNLFNIYVPECVWAEGGLIVAGHHVCPLIPWHHFLQWCVLNDIKADAHAGSALHVVHMLGLQNGVDRQALNIQLHAH